MSGQFAADYVDVATRIVEFRAQYPDGSLQPARLDKPYELVEVAGSTWLVYGAAAYRSPSDERPGIGYAWEQVPGKTPYTRGSELQNSETSAWGRAIVAVLAADTKRGVASAEEVAPRQAEQQQERAAPPSDDPSVLRGHIARVVKAHGVGLQVAAEEFAERHGHPIGEGTADELRGYLHDLTGRLGVEAAQ